MDHITERVLSTSYLQTTTSTGELQLGDLIINPYLCRKIKFSCSLRYTILCHFKIHSKISQSRIWILQKLVVSTGSKVILLQRLK